uniref:Uncharacterized protein n=1 Tax=Palpitomonas bilix TaxID=652834 RepID=A0A7S3G6T5_9EUKA|mmetsp:Transcript_34464/g.89269  ORF Transcript_34464/g.89269 Transcript_34464/m.89269 type:complete len:258 (+) Transcript_34464:148-921(+)
MEKVAGASWRLIVTGASSGIGEAIAARFATAGWDVTNLSRRPCPVEGVKSKKVDMSDPSDTERVCDEVAKELDAATSASSQLDQSRLCIVHNAASQPVDSMADPRRRAEDMQKELNIQVVSPSLLTSRLSPHLQAWKGGSSVIYIGSTLSEKAVPNKALYSTCKHAMVGMMRATVQDFFGKGVHTALVCPGFTETPLLVNALKDADASGELEKRLLSNVSFGRMVKPEEIASVVEFVANNPATNGTILHANLGQLEY